MFESPRKMLSGPTNHHRTVGKRKLQQIGYISWSHCVIEKMLFCKIGYVIYVSSFSNVSKEKPGMWVRVRSHILDPNSWGSPRFDYKSDLLKSGSLSHNRQNVLQVS